MKKIVVFGGAGFIGQHVVKNLIGKGVRPVIFDRWVNGFPNVEDIKDYSIFVGDIKDREAVNYAVEMSDGAINLAGILGTSETVDNPFPSVEVNIMGALNFLQACRIHDKPGVQIAVGNFFMNNSYSITKSTAERLALMFNKEHGTKIAVVRALNAYGEGQKHYPIRKIMPNFIVRALQNKPIEIYGDGEQVMDMVYVGDVAEALTRSLLNDHGQYARPIEIGTGRPTSVNEIAEAVIKASGSTGGIKHIPMRKGEPEGSIVIGHPETLNPIAMDATNLMTLEVGVNKVVKWYKENYDWQNAKV